MQQAARGAGIEFYLQEVEEGDFIVSPHPPPPPDDSLVHASVVSLLAECVLRTEGESADNGCWQSTMSCALQPATALHVLRSSGSA